MEELQNNIINSSIIKILNEKNTEYKSEQETKIETSDKEKELYEEISELKLMNKVLLIASKPSALIACLTSLFL